MKRTVSLLIAVFCLGVALGAVVVNQSHAQETPKEYKAPISIDQHWIVKPNILPDNLQAELKSLNAEGIAVAQSEIVIVNDKFTIMVCDSDGDEGH